MLVGQLFVLPRTLKISFLSFWPSDYLSIWLSNENVDYRLKKKMPFLSTVPVYRTIWLFVCLSDYRLNWKLPTNDWKCRSCLPFMSYRKLPTNDWKLRAVPVYIELPFLSTVEVLDAYVNQYQYWSGKERSRGKDVLKGHLRALPTEIISPAKWRSNRKWRPTVGPADRLATKFPKISSFWWVLQWAAATTGPGNMSLRASAPSTENIVRSRFFRLLWSWWMIGRQGRPVDSTRRMEAYGTSRNVKSFYLGAGLTTCWRMEAEETTRQSQVRLRRSG